MEIPTEKPEDFHYAWFSAKAASRARSMGPQQQEQQGFDGHSRVRLPPRTVHPLRHFGRLEDGTEVEFNFLTEGPDHGAGWDDIVFVGLVRSAHRRHERMIPGSPLRVTKDFELGKGVTLKLDKDRDPPLAGYDMPMLGLGGDDAQPE